MDELEILLQLLELKDEKRTGWQLRNIDDPESVADHSWSTAFLCLLHGKKEDVDVDKAVKIALVHDIGEAETGDIAHRAVDAEQEMDSEDKQVMERKAVQKLSHPLDTDIEQLWKEYEERRSEESKFVKDMDMIDLCLQALKYEKQARYDKTEDNPDFKQYDDLDEFFATTEPRLTTETGKKLFHDIRDRYKKAKKE
ncbi:MAG: HD domain-containing protein [Candidatus Nanohaloarchaea archaeon]